MTSDCSEIFGVNSVNNELDFENQGRIKIDDNICVRGGLNAYYCD